MKTPVMDGRQFAAELHARHGSTIPIVVLTAAEDARKHAEEVGAVGWIGKAFDVDLLIEEVRRHIASELPRPLSGP